MSKSAFRCTAVLTAAIFMVLLSILGCKKKEYFPEPGLILNNWSRATQELNYDVYSKCEAYPREVAVFNEMYKFFYFTNITIVKVEDLDEKDVRTDFEGKRFHKRNVIFECMEVSRGGKSSAKQVKGEVFFIKFLDGSKAKDGWLMANRTLIRY